MELKTELLRNGKPVDFYFKIALMLDGKKDSFLYRVFLYEANNKKGALPLGKIIFSCDAIGMFIERVDNFERPEMGGEYTHVASVLMEFAIRTAIELNILNIQLHSIEASAPAYFKQGFVFTVLPSMKTYHENSREFLLAFQTWLENTGLQKSTDALCEAYSKLPIKKSTLDVLLAHYGEDSEKTHCLEKKIINHPKKRFSIIELMQYSGLMQLSHKKIHEWRDLSFNPSLKDKDDIELEKGRNCYGEAWFNKVQTPVIQKLRDEGCLSGWQLRVYCNQSEILEHLSLNSISLIEQKITLSEILRISRRHAENKPPVNFLLESVGIFNASTKDSLKNKPPLGIETTTGIRVSPNSKQSFFPKVKIDSIKTAIKSVEKLFKMPCL